MSIKNVTFSCKQAFLLYNHPANNVNFMALTFRYFASAIAFMNAYNSHLQWRIAFLHSVFFFLITPRVLTFLKEPVQTHYKISIKDQSAAISKIKVGKKKCRTFPNGYLSLFSK